MANGIIEMNNEFKLIKKYEQISELITANLKKGVRTNTAMSREDYEREISHGSLMAGETPQGLIILRNRPSHVKLNYYINDTGSPIDMAELEEAVRSAGWNEACEGSNNKGGQECPSPDKPIAVETAFRERDAALKETAGYLAGCGFKEVLSRVRLSRPADEPEENAGYYEKDMHGKTENIEEKNGMLTFYVKKSAVEDAAAIRPLLNSSFDPVTGCLPEDDELHSDAAAGNILMLFAVHDSRAASEHTLENLTGAAVPQPNIDSRHPAAVPQPNIDSRLTAAVPNASRHPAARPCGLLHYAAAKKSAEIKHLAIAPEYRGCGLSAALINAFLNECSGMKTTVWTGSGNAPALNAYKDCGFTEDGRRSSVMIYIG